MSRNHFAYFIFRRDWLEWVIILTFRLYIILGILQLVNGGIGQAAGESKAIPLQVERLDDIVIDDCRVPLAHQAKGRKICIDAQCLCQFYLRICQQANLQQEEWGGVNITTQICRIRCASLKLRVKSTSWKMPNSFILSTLPLQQ